MGTILDEIVRESHMNSACKASIKQMLQEVMNDVLQVFEFGATKHPDSGSTPNFLTEEGNKCAHKDRGSSCLRHAAELYAGKQHDDESNLHPALHLISSAAIMYIRQKRDIIHPGDK